jgi:hypothetical protein
MKKARARITKRKFVAPLPVRGLDSIESLGAGVEGMMSGNPESSTQLAAAQRRLRLRGATTIVYGIGSRINLQEPSCHYFDRLDPQPPQSYPGILLERLDGAFGVLPAGGITTRSPPGFQE